jgi:hypothetical protein
MRCLLALFALLTATATVAQPAHVIDGDTQELSR